MNIEGAPAPQEKSPKKVGALVRAGIVAGMVGFAGASAEAAETKGGAYDTKAGEKKIEQVQPKMSKKEFSDWAAILNSTDVLRVVSSTSLNRPKMTSEQWKEVNETLIQKIGTEVAMHAWVPLPVFGKIKTDPSLSQMDKVKRSLVFSLLQSPKFDNVASLAVEKKIQAQEVQVGSGRFIIDPKAAKVMFGIIKDLSARYMNANPVEVEHVAAMVARNLSARGEAVSDASVQEEVERVLQTREKISGEKLLDANMLLVSSNALAENNQGVYKKGDPLFGTTAFFQQIKQNHTEQNQNRLVSLTHISPLQLEKGKYVSTPERVAQAKEKTLDTIRNLTAPLTVYFDGHGSDNAWHFSGGEVENLAQGEQDDAYTKITAQELADALKARFEKQQKDGVMVSNISLLFNSCFSQNFARAVVQELQANNVPLPKAIATSSEFGQYTFLPSTNPQGSSFNTLMSTSKTFGDVMKGEYTTPQDSKPSMFVPAKTEDGKEVLQQISGVVVPVWHAQASVA